MKNYLKNFILVFILIFSNTIKAQKNLTINNLSEQQTFYINIYTDKEDGWEKINNGCEEIKPQQTIKISLKKEFLENELGASIWTNKNDCLKENRNTMRFSIDVVDPKEVKPLQINISDNKAYFGKGTNIEIPKKEEDIDLKLQIAFTVDLPRIYQEQIPYLQIQKYKQDPDILGNPKIDEIKTLNDVYKATEDEELQEAQRYIKSIRLRAVGRAEGFAVIDNPKWGDWIYVIFPKSSREFNVKMFSRENQEPLLQDFDDTIKQISTTTDKNIKTKLLEKSTRIINQLVKLYKIHLMPKEAETEKIIIDLLQKCSGDPELKNAISTIKINPDSEKELIEKKEPRIVIYTNPGKNLTQQALNKLYNIFKTHEGSNIIPKYNQKITSLIYWAQGNRDEKNIKDFSDYYDEPNKVCYKKNIKQMINPQAPEEDYYLINPVKK